MQFQCRVLGPNLWQFSTAVLPFDNSLCPWLSSVCGWLAAIYINNKIGSSASTRIKSAFRNPKTGGWMDYYTSMMSEKSRKSQWCVSWDPTWAGIWAVQSIPVPHDLTQLTIFSFIIYLHFFFLRYLSLQIAKSSSPSAWSKTLCKSVEIFLLGFGLNPQIRKHAYM